jgi:hypothetical protein
MIIKNIFIYLLLAVAATIACNAQTGTGEEPVRYIGGEITNPNVHDGALRYAVGVENIQVVRANRTHPEITDDFGWTYNHAPDLTYWNNTFFLQYLSNPVNEHEAPGHTMLVTSKDGRKWNKPVELFPPYQAPQGVKIPDGYKGYMMHQRMGFYTAPNGKLLSLAFYGHAENPFKEGGIGRVVREIYKDGSLGPIYFIRYSSHANWNQGNTSFPFYKESKDRDFVKACEALLCNKLKTLQWLEEDRGLDGFYTLKDSVNTVQALSYYHRKDGKVVGLWKNSFVTLSDNDGLTWSAPKAMPSLIMAGGKNWGQKTIDGRYAMCYNPIATQEYRYPLTVITSDDGILFDNMGVVHGEVPPRRFYGRWKDFGPNYMRGISEGESTPPGSDMWLTYSVNKEDIWISRIPLPIRVEVKGNVFDDFNQQETFSPVNNWNIYSPRWAPVYVDNFPNKENKSLKLEDQDPYDYAKATRIFESAQKTTLSFKVYIDKVNEGSLQIEVTDRYGNRPVRLIFDRDLILKIHNGSLFKDITNYKEGKWYSISIEIQATGLGSFNLFLDDQEVIVNQQFAEAVKTVERITFRTGDYRNLPDRKTPNQIASDPLPGADIPLQKSIYHIDDVRILDN